MEYNIWQEDKYNKIENSLNNIIKEKDNSQNIIYKSMNYSLLAGGKRFRPLLMIGSYEIFKENDNIILPFACAMEMIHTYSLIHDDLPAMDDDDYRRGKLSNHKKFGEAVAILAGDALLNKAFEIGLEAIITHNLDTDSAVRALSIISKSSGTEGMIGGQIIDIEDNIQALDELINMYSHKTGAIIKSSVLAGAILGGATKDEIEALKIYSENLGIAFQIQDDILDVEGNQEKTGKPVGSDMGNNKKTYLTFVNIEQAKLDVEQYTQDAINSLVIFQNKASSLSNIAQSLLKRDH